MSMNLSLKLDGQFYEELWQTPTYITHMCLVDSDGFVNNLFAEDALRGLEAYKIWVKSHTNGAWGNHEDLEGMRNLVTSHIEDLEISVKQAKKIELLML
jgi:hypothetical protein